MTQSLEVILERKTKQYKEEFENLKKLIGDETYSVVKKELEYLMNIPYYSPSDFRRFKQFVDELEKKHGAIEVLGVCYATIWSIKIYETGRMKERDFR